MSLTSLEFVIFVLIAAIGYYLIPKRFQWVWLLIFSYIYYLASGLNIIFFLLFSTATTYLAGLLMDNIKLKHSDNKYKKKMKRRVVIITLLLNFGMLAFVKYTNFAIVNINQIFGSQLTFQSIILPLGISFYTFQSMGYLLDVYWEKVKAERNPFRFALFVSFFPQILQGPIGRFDRLANQLYEKHYFNWNRMEQSFQLILWGFFKKMVIADNAAGFVDAVFSNYEKYSGVTIIVAVLGYSIQLYGDFSGGMDVVKGVAGLFGVKLDDNFKRPYFAISITDFWHRWHITLGTWMKDYVFYPLSLSKGMNKFSKFAKKQFGKNIGRVLPICLSNIVVFLLVGIWHGAAWKFIAYGLYNGLIIAFSGLMMQSYRKWKKALHINDKSKIWMIFQIIRTFLLVNISWYFDRANGISEAFDMIKITITDFYLSDFSNGSLLLDSVDFIVMRFVIIGLGCAILFLVSFYQEKGVNVSNFLLTKPTIIRFSIYLILLFALPSLGQPPSTAGGFIYAQF